jgi:hypothetical protein
MSIKIMTSKTEIVFQRDNKCSLPSQMDSTKLIPQVESMIPLWQLGKTEAEKTSLRKSTEGGTIGFLYVAVPTLDGTDMTALFLPTSEASGSLTRVPHNSYLVRDQNSQSVFLPVVSGG